MAVAAVAESSRTPAIFNVSDNRPVLRREYYCELARLYSLAPDQIQFVDNVSQQAESTQSEQQRQRMARKTGSKRVSSAAITKALGLEWKYPSYREGLASLVRTAGG